MKRRLVSDVELRATWRGGAEYHVEPGTILTPAARDFIREKGIRLCFDGGEPGRMTVTPIPKRNGAARYQILETGEETGVKAERMTHLRGNLLVPKTHPRIKFRGKLDALMAQVLEVQVTALEERSPQTAGELEEILACLRRIMSAEVREEPLAALRLWGMDSAGLRYASQHVRECLGVDHMTPSFRMGRLCVELNTLRTAVRELELLAAETFRDERGGGCRDDILEALNRLSSAVYILFCRRAAAYIQQEETR